ncbi:MAG: ribonuclease D [Limnothrix sp. RL_2_0]|nr:ribonuclease D [Limnothrix sp. RL_2_0]
MPYLTNANDVKEAIARLRYLPILWVDTEVADYKSKTPRLSLIQILANSTDLTGEQVLIFDVLDQPELIDYFIAEIMENEAIAKVFHNKSFDLRYLGKKRAKNVTCTLELAKKLPYYLAPKPDNTLKVLAENLCHFPNIDKESQSSDWGQRPLTDGQIKYAYLDPVYTAQVHHRLLQLQQQINIDPATENIDRLTRRYRQIEHDWQMLDSEVKHIKDRLKNAMAKQSIDVTTGFKLSASQRLTRKINLSQLAEAIANRGLQLDSTINLTKTIQEELGDILEELPLEEKIEVTHTLRSTKIEDSDVPF